jgi:hypothetical protein
VFLLFFVSRAYFPSLSVALFLRRDEIRRITDLILENFGGRLGDLNAILSIHMLEGIPIEGMVIFGDT